MGKKRTLEEVQTEALKYTNRSEFQKKAAWAYLWARRRGLCDQVCAHMRVLKQRWTKQKVAAEASKYTKRIDFQRKSPNAYAAALAHGWLDDVCKYEFHRVLRKWTDAEIKAEADKYTSHKDFRTFSPKAYEGARRRGILDDVCGHMQKGKQKKWTKEAIRLEALRYSRRKDFQVKSNSAYTSAVRAGILDDVCAHMVPDWRAVSDAEVIAKASEYETLSDFYHGAASYYTLAVRRKMLGSVITHLRKVQRSEWDADSVIAEARKYNRRSDMYFQAPGALAAARRLGLLDAAFEHMDDPWCDRFKWTDDYLHTVALRYQTKADFIRGNKNEYQACYRRDILSRVCTHMGRIGPSVPFGFQPGRVARLYIVAISHAVHGDRVGYGISGNVDHRLKEHARNLGREGYCMDVIGISEQMIGFDIKALEDMISESFSPAGIPVAGFRRECLLREYTEELLSLVSSFVDVEYCEQRAILA